MNEKLKEIIYVPTLRCNFNCTHCGQNRLSEEMEESASFILKHVLDNAALGDAWGGGRILITGGEPFLKDDIEEFILGIMNQENDFEVNITTNGFFYKKIEQLLKKVKHRDKISFAISLDGLECTHNEIRGNKHAYEYAIRTIQLLLKYSVSGQVNTVMQKRNIGELAELGKEIEKAGKGKIHHAYIPLVSQISKTKDFVFSKEEIKSIWNHITESRDEKYLLSSGEFKIEKCHAGQNNILISPQGKLFSCLTGYSYLKPDERENYCLGDLHEDTLEGILQKRDKEAVWAKTVASCTGCNNPCEIIREEEYFELNCELGQKEIYRLFEMKLVQDDSMVYDENWYGREGESENSFRWMKGNASRVYIYGYQREYNIKFINLLSAAESEEAMRLTVTVGSEKYIKTCAAGLNELKILRRSPRKEEELTEVIFHTNYTWKPSERMKSTDHRALGIALVSINNLK